MRLPTSLFLVLVGTVLLHARLVAQASPNVPLDDPRLPLVEHLIARGTMPDPSPMIRPFRRSDVIQSLRRADTTKGSVDAELVRRLSAEFTGERHGPVVGFRGYTRVPVQW